MVSPCWTRSWGLDMRTRTGLSNLFLLATLVVGGCWAAPGATQGLTQTTTTFSSLQGPNSSTPANHAESLVKYPNVRHPKPADIKVECNTLRSKRYISDGFCTSYRPITEVVCQGHCLPMKNLPWYAEMVKIWSRTKMLEYRCVNDVVRRKNVTLLCDNGETRTYKIKVVKSCKCKKSRRRGNRSRDKLGRKSKRKNKRKLNLSDPKP